MYATEWTPFIVIFRSASSTTLFILCGRRGRNLCTQTVMTSSASWNTTATGTAIAFRSVRAVPPQKIAVVQLTGGPSLLSKKPAAAAEIASLWRHVTLRDISRWAHPCVFHSEHHAVAYFVLNMRASGSRLSQQWGTVAQCMPGVLFTHDRCDGKWIHGSFPRCHSFCVSSASCLLRL